MLSWLRRHKVLVGVLGLVLVLVGGALLGRSIAFANCLSDSQMAGYQETEHWTPVGSAPHTIQAIQAEWVALTHRSFPTFGARLASMNSETLGKRYVYLVATPGMSGPRGYAPCEIQVVDATTGEFLYGFAPVRYAPGVRLTPGSLEP